MRRAPGARERAAGAGRGDERVELAVRLRDDLRTRRALVRVAIDGVLELIRPHRARKRFGDAARFVIIVRLVGERLRFDDAQIGAVGAQRGVLLRRLIVGHDDDRAIAARVGGERQPDAGVPGGAFDDDAARMEEPAPFEVFDDAERGAIFDRTAGIEELGLAEDLAADRRGEFRQTDQRRVPDRAAEAVRERHAGCVIGCCSRSLTIVPGLITMSDFIAETSAKPAAPPASVPPP